tara:strand:+ start:6396 stop:7238 length:843 start_codon:yes stop_codon:yes gene_type:complete
MAEEQEEWKPEEDDELIVDIVDEDGNLVEESEPEPEPEPEQGSRRDKRIDQLTAKHNDERRAREASDTENKQLRERLDKVESDGLHDKREKFRDEYEDVKERLLNAAEEGNSKEQVMLTEKMADMRAAARIADMQTRRPESEPAPQQQPAPQQAPPPEEALTWWRSNSWFNSDGYQDASKDARAIDMGLEAEGWDKETPAYYAELDNRLQKKHPELYSSSRKPKAPVAPSSARSSAKASSSKDGRIRLTKDQLDMARQLGITEEHGLREYALEIQKLEKA